MKYSLRSLMIVVMVGPPIFGMIWTYLEPYPSLRGSLVALVALLLGFFFIYLWAHFCQ